MVGSSTPWKRERSMKGLPVIGAAHGRRRGIIVPDAEGKTVRDISKKGGKGMWDDIPLGLKAAGLNVRIFVDDVKKIVNYETDNKGKGKGKEKIKVDVISHDGAGYAGGFNLL